MMRIQDTIVNFFFDALAKKIMKRSRVGVGLNSLNINVDQGWRPPLPKEFYPSLIKLIWRCWDDDPDVRPDFDDIVALLMGDVGLGVKTNEEPVFGSGKIIADVEQRERDLVDAGGEMVPRKVMEEILKDKDRELDILVMERDKAVNEMVKEKDTVMKDIRADHNKKLKEKNLELKNKLKEKDKELEVLRTTGRGAAGGGGGGHEPGEGGHEAGLGDGAGGDEQYDEYARAVNM